jgi:ABC-2 type transport system ATP-binding protein
MCTAQVSELAPTSDAVREPLVTLTAVGRFAGDRAALADISLVIRSGEIHGLLGPNGSGKTTLLRILAGIWHPHVGRIEYPGAPVRIGYVPQRFCLYDELTVGENLGFQAAMRGRNTTPVARVLSDFSLEALASRRSAALSDGERQRLMLAAAMLSQPTLLLLDEPTTALDTASRRSLWSLLRREATHGTAVVLTSHELADGAQCDSTTRLSEGRLEERSR